jgi:pimeloyl-ACP methyl ester carboxylesterase
VSRPAAISSFGFVATRRRYSLWDGDELPGTARYAVRHKANTNRFWHLKEKSMEKFAGVPDLSCLATYRGKGLTGFRHLASRNRTVVVFIHGLGGRSFGKKRTWLNLPEFLWEDFGEVDVAFHSYNTLFRRLIFWKSVSLREEARALADDLSLLPYENIILVGHSLGGVLARLALKQLVDRKDDATLSRIVSTILMASPTLGAISPLFDGLSHDARALARDSEIVEEIEQLYNGSLSPRFDRKLHTPGHVPLWAITAAADSWVSKLSARAQVPDAQRRAAVGSHTDVVKPETKESPSYGHFVAIMRRILDETQPAILYRMTAKRFEIRPATSADAVAVFNCATGAFPGQEVSPPETMVSWLKWDPCCVWVLRKLSPTVSGEVQGYWCAFSLTEAAVNLIKSGEITGPKLRYEHFEEYPFEKGGIYVGAVVGNNKMAMGLVMKYAHKELEKRTRGRIVEVVARAVTNDGLDLVKTLGFAGVNGTGVGSIFSGASSAKVKGRRRSARI